MVADRFATDHTEFVVKPDAIDLVGRLVWHHDQPFGDSSAIPTFLLSELTRGHVTVALSGDGGDELFAGYERFNAGVALQRFGGVLGSRPVAAVAGAGSWPGASAKVQRALRRGRLGMPDAFMTWVSLFGPDRRRELTGASENWATEDYRSIWRESAGSGPLERLLDLNLRTYLLDDLLVKVDRTSMAHGLEVRSPFLDRELLELSQRLPGRAHAGLVSRKRALRAAVGDLLPAEILRRGKRGFGVPLDRWFRSDLRSYVESTLGAPSARVRAHLAGEPIDAMLAEQSSGRGQHGHGLWTLLTLEVFLQREGW
jgi:asparagine synthase (glutamine-hydrolysing)